MTEEEKPKSTIVSPLTGDKFTAVIEVEKVKSVTINNYGCHFCDKEAEVREKEKPKYVSVTYVPRSSPIKAG